MAGDGGDLSASPRGAARRPGWGWLAAVCLATAGGGSAAAEPASGSQAAARAVFEAHCARCHAGPSESAAADDVAGQGGAGALRVKALERLKGILDLDALARQPEFVRPGEPEASRILQVMVARHMPYDVHHGLSGGAEPSVEEIEAVAAWIAALERPANCVPAGGDGQAGEAMRRWLDGPLLTPVERERVVVVLLGAANACRGSGPDSDQRRRLAVRLIADALQLGEDAVVALAVPRVGGVVALVPAAGFEGRFDATPLWHSQSLAARARIEVAGLGGSLPVAVVDLKGLAERAVAPSGMADGHAPAGEHAAAASHIAGHGRRSVSLFDAAAEVGLSPTALESVLASHEGDAIAAARALRQGAIPSRLWDDLLPRLAGLAAAESSIGAAEVGGAAEVVGAVGDGGASPPADLAAEGSPVMPPSGDAGVAEPGTGLAPPVPMARPEVVPAAFRDVLPDGLLLWSTPLDPRVGDEIALSVESTQDCRLTLLNIEASGRTTVLFPNMFTPDNRIEAGRIIEIPSEDDPYVLVLEKAGRETFIAICLMEDRAAPPGIAHDFDLKPFTPLGQWRDHRRASLAADRRERDLVGQKVSRRSARRFVREGIVMRGDRRPLRQMRAAIVVEVDPAEPSGDR